MRTAVILLAIAALAVVALARRPKWQELHGYTFEKYETDFHKVYKTAEERATRKGLFEEQLKAVMHHNHHGHHSWKKGINQMSDWTREEIKRLNGGRLHENWNVRSELLKKPYVSTYKLKGDATTLPRFIDYTLAHPAVLTAVKDQGMCGSCWAHGSTEQMETYWALATGELNVLSQQQVTACAPNPNQCGGVGGCGGSIAELAYDYVVSNGGLTEEWEYPYTAWSGTTGTCQTGSSPVIQLSGYVKVPTNDQNAVMEALATQGPLAVNVDASDWSAYESGIFSGCNFASNISIDHVVQLVGYGHDDDLGLDYWLVRNSWTPSYGELGYIRVLKQSQPACGWDVNPQQGTGCKGGPNQLWTCGTCGILFDTSYPVVNTKG